MASATMDLTGDETSALLRECDWVHRLARALVADPGAAADAAQDTLVLALRRTPRAGAPLRPWLAGLLKNLLRQDRRSAQRRVAREERYSAAVGEREAEPVSQLERLELHRHVIALVQALDEPYRSTVVMRFLEDRAPNEIARSTGVPVKTVYTRIERALTQLRSELDRREGERGVERRHGWALALMPASLPPLTAAPPAAALSRGLWTIWIIMSTTQRSLLAVALLLAVGFGLRSGLGGASRATPALPGTPTVEGLVAGQDHDATSVAAERSRVPVEQDVTGMSAPSDRATASATTAIVDVVVRQAETGATIANIGVWARMTSASIYRLNVEGKLTDAAGHARFEVRAPGTCMFDDDGESQTVDLVPGEIHNVELTYASVRRVRGVVVGPDGELVAGAGVWVSNYHKYINGLVVGHTTQDGRFEVAVRGNAYVGARLSGHLASHLVQLSADVDELRLVLRGVAGRLKGVVRDDLGAPVAGAFVRLGVELSWLPPGPDGQKLHGAPGALVRSDTEGRFKFDECEPGGQGLLVRAKGFAPEEQVVETPLPVDGVYGEQSTAEAPELEVVLLRGVTIEGSVTDAGGRLIAGATIGFGDSSSLEGGLSRSDGNGRYILDSAPLGPVELKASAGGVGVARTTVSGRPGETLTWNPVLSSGPELSGSIVDERGAPRVGYVVEAHALSVGDKRSIRTVTDDAGRFKIKDVPRGTYDLHISPPEPRQTIVVEEGVEADGPPRTIVVVDAALMTATVTGTITGLGEVALDPALPIFARGAVDPQQGLSLKVDGERFVGGPWAAGEYELNTNSRTYPQTCIARFTLAPGEQRDLGVLHLEPAATLVVEVATNVGAPAFDPNEVHARLRGRDALEGTWRAHLLDEHGQGSLALAPGSYSLVASDRRSVACVMAVELAPGEVVHARLVMQAATKLEVAVSGGRDAGREPVEFEVRDGCGALVLRDGVAPLELPFAPRVHLLPAGVYQVRAVQGRRVGAAVNVTMPRLAGSPPIELGF